MNTVIEMLLGAGWKEKGAIGVRGQRLRFCLGKKRRCTVGKITTCFYDANRGKLSNFRNHRTKDLEAINREINQDG
jgi:hypothetical protein